MDENAKITLFDFKKKIEHKRKKHNLKDVMQSKKKKIEHVG
jgi:hypothetical protein